MKVGASHNIFALSSPALLLVPGPGWVWLIAITGHWVGGAAAGALWARRH